MDEEEKKQLRIYKKCNRKKKENAEVRKKWHEEKEMPWLRNKMDIENHVGKNNGKGGGLGSEK